MDATAKLLEKYLNAHLAVVLIWGAFIMFKSPPVWSEALVSKAMEVVLIFIGGGYIKDSVVAYISRKP
jgi:hypothetical protein